MLRRVIALNVKAGVLSAAKTESLKASNLFDIRYLNGQSKTITSNRRGIINFTRYLSSTVRRSSKFENNTKTDAERLLDERLNSLERLANKDILESTEDFITDETVLNVIKTASLYQESIFDATKSMNDANILKANEIAKSVMKNEKVHLTENLLKSIFLLKPQFRLVSTAINTYYDKNPGKFIEKSVALIPFRHTLIDADYHHALDLIDLTCGHPRYIEGQRKAMWGILYKFCGGVAGLIGAIDIFIRISYPHLAERGMLGIYAMIVTYFFNAAVLGSISFAGKGTENGPLRFKNNTLQNYWFQHVDQIRMASNVLEGDAAVNGLEGFATKPIVDRITAMNFMVNEPEQEVMLRQYWMSSGEGFVWVEPDQDPAEIQWEKHLENIGRRKVWSGSQRPDQINEGEGEHASNISSGPKQIQ